MWLPYYSNKNYFFTVFLIHIVDISICFSKYQHNTNEVHDATKENLSKQETGMANEKEEKFQKATLWFVMVHV